MNPLLKELRNDISGAEILADWLGTGDPVHPMVAEARAKRCLTGNDGKPCHHNKAARWWETAKEMAADWIRAQIELKNHMSLRVQNEEGLHMCGLCGCCLPTKIWTPIEHIKNHLPADTLAQAPSWCWMRAEIESHS